MTFLYLAKVLRKKRQCLQLSFNVYFRLNFCQMLSSDIFLLKIDADFNTFIYSFIFTLFTVDLKLLIYTKKNLCIASTVIT